MNLIPNLWKLFVRRELGGDRGEDLLVGHPENYLARLSVEEPEHLVAHDVETPGLPPYLGGMQRREEELLATDGVHLFLNDLADLAPRPIGQWQEGVDASHQLADECCPNEQLVAHGLRIGWVVAKSWNECF